MATGNNKVKSAEKALQEAKEKYNSASSTVYVKPDYELQRKKANEAYVTKLRATNKKKKEAESEGLKALDKLKAAYQKKRQDAVYDSIDNGIQRSSIVKGQLDEYNRAQTAEEKEKVQQITEEIRDYDEQLSQYRLDKDYKLYEIDQEEQEWEQKEQQRKTKAALKKQVEQREAEYKAAVQEQKEVQAAEKQQTANKNKGQADYGTRPDYISEKYWERVKETYEFLQEKGDAYTQKYLRENAYRLRIQLSEGGFYWLHKKLGLM